MINHFILFSRKSFFLHGHVSLEKHINVEQISIETPYSFM